ATPRMGPLTSTNHPEDESWAVKEAVQSSHSSPSPAPSPRTDRASRKSSRPCRSAAVRIRPWYQYGQVIATFLGAWHVRAGVRARARGRPPLPQGTPTLSRTRGRRNGFGSSQVGPLPAQGFVVAATEPRLGKGITTWGAALFNCRRHSS